MKFHRSGDNRRWANHQISDGVELSNEGKAEDGASVIGRVRIGKGSAIAGRPVVRGQAAIGENCKIGPNAYIGPYTVIGDRCQISASEIDDSIVMDDTTLHL